jgi:hypothetical protein
MKANSKSNAKVEIVYGSANRDFAGGEHYLALAIAQLQLDFPFIPMSHIRTVFSSNKKLYAPT